MSLISAETIPLLEESLTVLLHHFMAILPNPTQQITLMLRRLVSKKQGD